MMVPMSAPSTADAVRRGERWLHVLTPVVVLAVAAFIAFWRLDQANVGADETVYQRAGVAYLDGDLSLNPEHPPFAKLLLGLWQAVVGPGIDSARIAMGIVMVLTAAVAFLWIRAAVGTASAAAASLMLVTTHRVVGADFVDRQVLLDPFSILFGLVGLALLWRWNAHRQPWLAAIAGVALGLALLSKASAAAFLIGALVLVPWRALRQAQVWGSILAFAAAGIATCLVVYAPFGGVDAVASMIAWQAEHAERGHLVEIAGQTYRHAPWFAIAWLGGETVGWLALVAIALAAALGVVLERRLRAVLAIASAGAAAAVLLSASPVALPHYTIGWLWAPLLLSGIGIVALWRRVRSRRAGVIAGALTALLLVGPASGVVHVLSVSPTGVARIDAAMAADPAPDGAVLVLQLSRHVARPNIEAPFVEDPGADGVTAVAIGNDLRFPADPELVLLLERETQPVVLDDVVLYLLDEELDELLAEAP
ncbi:Dolichyl-phosphate-mannose-protein mannosyltransferase [Agrococcus baldri]|uniref:Dolichyl-phosphate-mannose-protein mannosyltransferase n=2 Tax=Agrococcus baldri TaxID=153730 RepID=A0AA94HN09_9MICO|nr:Dolichyl-phosphate-mannose-protein mannosyltransferase [Agrococcus baldri]